jgi:hypothetical protein
MNLCDNLLVHGLKELKISHNNDTIIILPASFDTYFKKTNGNTILEIK